MASILTAPVDRFPPVRAGQTVEISSLELQKGRLE